MHHEVVVVGAGMAGASAAWALAEQLDVLLVEQEPQAGQHATGRSAAVLSETSGTAITCAWPPRAGRSSRRRPAGFGGAPSLSAAVDLLWVGQPGQEAALDEVAERGQRHAGGVERVGEAEVRRLFPVLQPEWASVGGVHEPGAAGWTSPSCCRATCRGRRRRGRDDPAGVGGRARRTPRGPCVGCGSWLASTWPR